MASGLKGLGKGVPPSRWCGVVVTVILWLGMLRSVGAAAGGPPFISTQPQCQNAAVGSTVTFTVNVDSGTAVIYQWLFFGMNIPGANGTNLTLTNVQPGQAGLYSVVVENAYGSEVSANAALRLFTQTLLHNWQSIYIPASGLATPYPSVILASNLPGFVSNIMVMVNGLAHSYPDDLEILLRGPSGVSVMLMSDAGGSNAINDVTLGFDDSATNYLPAFGPILSGIYKPTNYPPDNDNPPMTTAGSYASQLSAFQGSTPNGPWALWVWDDTPNSSGRIANGWNVNLTVNLPMLRTYTVTLAGTNEIPPTSSPATGSGLIVVHTNGLVSYDINYEGLTGEFADTFIQAWTGPGSNGVNLFQLMNYSNGPNAGSLHGCISNYLGNQLWDLRNGHQGVNLWSSTFTSGEIRGQIVPLVPPAILAHPQSWSASLGDPVSFNVVASSLAPVCYQWRLNQSNIPEATNSVLLLPNVCLSDAGFYDVVVSNEAGTLISSTANLTVTPLAYFEFVSLHLGVSDSRTLNNVGSTQAGCAIPCGLIGLSPRWLGFQLQSPGTLVIDTLGSDLDTLMAVYAGTNQAALSYVACNDNLASSNSRSWLKLRADTSQELWVEIDGVNGAQGLLQVNWRFGLEPMFLRQPSNQVVNPGSNVVFQAVASGVPQPTLQWQLNDQDIAGATNTTLVLSNVQPANAGIYRAVAQNFISASFSADARLRVRSAFAPPTIENGQIHCHLEAAPGATVIIQASSDLRKWSPVYTNSPATGIVDYFDAVDSKTTQRFYRALVF